MRERKEMQKDDDADDGDCYDDEPDGDEILDDVCPEEAVHLLPEEEWKRKGE